jgi:ADP-ribose pyrophosphatase
MDSINKERMLKAIRDFKVVDKELISTYQEGYIGKNIYKVTLSDGSTRRVEEILKRGVPGDAAVIIPITTEGNIIMVVQSRPNMKETVSVELPAGMVDPGESHQDTAVREMLEETGYEAKNVYELEWHYQDQGCSGAVIKTFVAEGCKKKQELRLDEGERLQYVEMSYEDIMNMIKSREISDANTKIAMMEYTLKTKGLL